MEAAKQEDLPANWEVFRGDDEQEAMTAEQGKLLRVQMDELSVQVGKLVEVVHVLVVVEQIPPQGCVQSSIGRC